MFNSPLNNQNIIYLNKPAILIIALDYRILMSLKSIFIQTYEVIITDDLQKALSIMREKTIDVVIADQMLTQITGIEILSLSHIVSPNTVRILIKSSELHLSDDALSEAQVFKVFDTPWIETDLQESVKSAILLANTLKQNTFKENQKCAGNKNKVKCLVLDKNNRINSEMQHLAGDCLNLTYASNSRFVFQQLKTQNIKLLVIAQSPKHRYKELDFLQKIKNSYPDVLIIFIHLGTPEEAQLLMEKKVIYRYLSFPPQRSILRLYFLSALSYLRKVDEKKVLLDKIKRKLFSKNTNSSSAQKFMMLLKRFF